MQQQPRAFTAQAPGLANVLISPCQVKPNGAEASAFREFVGVWDTGATSSAITQRVIDECKLNPIGRALVYHAGTDDDPNEIDTYLVDLLLLNGVVVREIEVGYSNFRGGDVLIGMDIINAGDFAITHRDGNTKFTFQIPSQEDIDFVNAQESPTLQNRQQRRQARRRNRRKP